MAISTGRQQVARATDATALTASFAGVIGSSADSFTDNPWRGFGFIRDMCCGASYGHTVQGYGEQHEISKTFSLATPNQPVSVTRNINLVLTHCCTDGAVVYEASQSGGFDLNHSIAVLAHTPATGDRYSFTSGTRLNFAGFFSGPGYNDGRYYLGFYESAIVLHQEYHAALVPEVIATQQITGLAVQQGTATRLACSRGGLDRIDFFHKTTGEALGTLSVPAPGRLSFAPNGDLWVVSDGQAVVYHPTAEDSLAYTKGLTLAGAGTVLAVSVSYDGATIRVASDTYQLILAYTPTGSAKAAFTQTVNNLLDPAVSNYSFQFRVKDGMAALNGDARYNTPTCFIAEQPDGSFWVQNAGNACVNHYSASYQYLGQIAYLSDYYEQCVNATDPTGFIANNLQFKIDLSRALQPGDQTQLANPSWKLTRNWTSPAGYGFIYAWCTLTARDGTKRTFGQVRSTPLAKWQLVELPANGPLRTTGQFYDVYPNDTFLETTLYGDCLRTVELVTTGRTGLDGFSWQGQDRQAVYEQPFLGVFDAQGDPQFGPRTQVWALFVPATGPTQAALTGVPLTPPRAPKLSNGNYVIFQPGQQPLGYSHLGFIKTGQTAYNTTTLPNKNAPGATPATLGPGYYPDNGSGSNFGGLTGVGVLSAGDYVLTVYNGQSGAFSNQLFLYDQNGSFLLQFGRTNDGASDFADLDKTPAGYPNNTLTASMTQVDTSLYVLLHDEVFHGGAVVYRVN